MLLFFLRCHRPIGEEPEEEEKDKMIRTNGWKFRLALTESVLLE